MERLRGNAIFAGTRELHIAVEARAGRGLDENPLGVPEPPLVAVKRAVIDGRLAADQMLCRAGDKTRRPADCQSVRRRLTA